MLSRHQSVLASLFDDWDAARDTLRRGEFLHVAASGGGVRDASFYGESFIPRSYVERVYGEWFEIIRCATDGEAGGLPSWLTLLRIKAPLVGRAAAWPVQWFEPTGLTAGRVSETLTSFVHSAYPRGTLFELPGIGSSS